MLNPGVNSAESAGRTANGSGPAHPEAPGGESTDPYTPRQLIAPDGSAVDDPDLAAWVADVGAERLVGLYRDMVLIRRLDTEATALQRQGELGLWPPLLGQEASQVGSVRALRSDDYLFPSYRENGVAFCRGANVTELLRMWRGTANAGWDPAAYNMAAAQIIIGAQALHAAGYAMGITLDGADTLALAYFGDGATSQGDVNEAMVFAASFQAPVVFFCQNNHWAISEPVGLQAHLPLAARAPGFGIPSMRVDGNDVLAVMAATRWAAHRARTGGGPSYIEAVTYRMGPHTTADDPTRYRDPNELEDWAAKDPITRMAAWLRARDLVDAAAEETIAADADALAKELRATCLAMPDPGPLEVFEHVYATASPALERAKDHYANFLSGFGTEGSLA